MVISHLRILLVTFHHLFLDRISVALFVSISLVETYVNYGHIIPKCASYYSLARCDKYIRLAVCIEILK